MRDEIAATGMAVPDSGIVSPGIDSAYLDAPSATEPDAWHWRLLYVGRVVEQKGVRTAIECLSMLPVESRLRIVGEGDPAYRAELERLADRLGVRGRVTFEAPVARSDLFSLYRACDVVLFPVQWAEPWGLVPLEAMALGRPVIATGRGGSGDYLEDRRNSLIFDPGDAAGLAEAVRQLATDADLRQLLRAHGFETAARHTAEEFNRGAADEMEAATRQRSPQLLR
jgi:glycosyltransferase involved in cell wall biosynthesis